MTFRICCPNFDSNELQIVFMPIAAHFNASAFFEHHCEFKPPDILRLTVDVPDGHDFGAQHVRDSILERLALELNTWLTSVQMVSPLEPNALPSVSPVIEYRQMRYGHYSIDAQIIRAPYAMM